MMLKWYLSKLKSRPIVTNLISSAVLMSVGDILAQMLERHHVGENPDVQKVPLQRRLSLRRYGTHNNINDRVDDDEEEDRLRKHIERVRRRPSSSEAEHGWQQSVRAQKLWDEVREGVKDLDGYRTLSMSGWAAGFMTPFFMSLYRFYDHLFRVNTYPSIIAKVAMTFVASIPVNALFFVYGTSVHHTAEWLALRRDYREELWDLGLDTIEITAILQADGPPFDMEMLVSKSELKITTELYNTMKTSAKAWIPINFLNFAFVPAHLRPLVFALCSVGWNCYLSLVQHRDLALPPDEEKQ
jgi:hypothetical protein